MDYTHFTREMMSVNNKVIAIEVLNSLIDIYAKEIYILDQQKFKDWRTIYDLQLKIDRTNLVIEELRKIN